MTPRVDDVTRGHAERVLEPALTAWDRRVLETLPERPDLGRIAAPGVQNHPPPLTAWQVAELLDTDHVTDVRRTLTGLEHLGHCRRVAGTHGSHSAFYRSRA